MPGIPDFHLSGLRVNQNLGKAERTSRDMVLLQCACYESDPIRSSLRHFDRSGGHILVSEGPPSTLLDLQL
jgi:hypothetical protein